MERDKTTEPESLKPLKIFFCYARKDSILREELEKHLEPLRRSGQITTWYDREIQPGMEWKQEIDKHLNTSDIVLLLVSPNFIHSDYCYGVEMRRALERHKAGDARIIPIILRPVDWESTPISLLQALPTDGKPILTWRNRDEAFKDVAKGLSRVVRILLSQERPERDEDPDFWFERWHAAYQQMKHFNQLKDVFLLTASHELRTPLTAVQGYLELLCEHHETLSPEITIEFLEQARVVCDELNLRVNTLVDAYAMKKQ